MYALKSMDWGISNNLKDLVNTFFKQITELGSLTITAVIIIIIYFLDKGLSIRLFLGILSVTIIAIIIKSLFFYDRPNKQKIRTLIDRIDASSFPSVHSARITVMIYLMISYFSNIILQIFLVIIGVLVIYSRIYLKKHYFRDIMAGTLLGLIVSMIIQLSI